MASASKTGDDVGDADEDESPDTTLLRRRAEISERLEQLRVPHEQLSARSTRESTEFEVGKRLHDRLLTSLADSFGPRAMAVVLAGRGALRPSGRRVDRAE